MAKPLMQDQQKTSLIIIDDHPLFRQGVIDVLRLEADFDVIADASNGEDGLALIRKHHPHIAITDVNLPDRNGLMVVEQVVQEGFSTRMILLTAYDDAEQKLNAFHLGAWGYCTKDIQPSDLVERIRAVVKGHYIVSDEIVSEEEFREWLAQQTGCGHQNEKMSRLLANLPLSPREMEVLSYLSLGQSNKEIAHHLGISHQTVKNHLASLFRKLGVEDRTQAVIYALQHGWVQMDSVGTKE